MIEAGGCGRLIAIALGIALWWWQPAIVAAAQPETANATIGFIELQNDPRHESLVAHARALLRRRGPPFDGARLGLEDSDQAQRMANVQISLDRQVVTSPDEAVTAIKQARESKGARFFLVDVPSSVWKPLLDALRNENILLFNISESDDWLRGAGCAANAVHTMPSQAKLSDALAQYLVSRSWRNILILEGPKAEDGVFAQSFAAAAKKFGARIVAHRKFVEGRDARQRDMNNPALLTAVSGDYDIVFIADTTLDFARELPYRTVRPRPVAGSIGLEPVAWHWSWDRFGAPQVSSRFRKISGGRDMLTADWAAWMAMRMIAEAYVHAGTKEFPALRDYILKKGSYDGAKGVVSSVRPWDHQLRQPVLLASADFVSATAPVAGFLHQIDTLDTLGADHRESACRMNGQRP